MIHQTHKKSKPSVADPTVVWETPSSACPSNKKRVRTVKNLIFVVTQMIQCRKREESHSAVKHLWGGGVRRSCCSTHLVRNLQAPFPTVFYTDLNQGWYWKHQRKRHIPSCFFHLDQLGGERGDEQGFCCWSCILTAAISRPNSKLSLVGRCKGSLSSHVLLELSYGVAQPVHGEGRPLGLQWWPVLILLLWLRGPGGGSGRGASDAGLQSQLLGRYHSSSKYKIWTVVLVLNICGILPNHCKQMKVNISEKGPISGRVYFLFFFCTVVCRLVFCDSVFKGKTLLKLRTSLFVSYSQTSQRALF